MPTEFAHLGLPQPLVRALTDRRITSPFPVQTAAIPDAIAGRDVSGRAPTGSGKTLAFGLPLLARVDRAKGPAPKALILAPTRELAEQITRELRPLAGEVGRRVFAVYGGVAYGPQKNALRKGVDVVVATPGRLEDLVAQRCIDLRQVDIAVLDEADRMADMGFLPEVRRILDQTPRRRQTLLFSATLDGDVAVLSREYQRNPVRHEVGSVDTEAVDAEHHFWLVDHHDRPRHIADLVGDAGRSIVFTRTRHGADRLVKQIGKLGVGAVALHGGRSQSQRTKALQAFASGRVQALVATDVAARGIHIDAVASVIHFDPPADSKDYLHRSGRTARAGATGTVVSLVTGPQRNAVRRLQRDLDLDTPIRSEPGLESLRSGNGDNRSGNGGNRSGNGGNGGPPPAPVRGDRRDRGDEQSVYVSNLPWSATDNELTSLFGRYGEVRRATVVTDRRTGRSRGFGFVEMPPAAARRAIERLDGSTLGDRPLRVRPARPRQPRR